MPTLRDLLEGAKKKAKKVPRLIEEGVAEVEEQVKGYVKPTPKVRVRDVLREMAPFAQETARMVGSVGLGVGRAALGKKGREAIPERIETKSSPAGRLVFGGKPVGTTTKEVSQMTLRDLGFSEEAAKREGTGPTAPFIAAGGVLMNISGAGKGRLSGKAAKQLFEKVVEAPKYADEIAANKAITSNIDTFMKQYTQRINDTFEATRGQVISSDDAKYAINDVINAGEDFTPERSFVYHEPGSALSKVVENDVLANPKTKELPGLVMSGGSGAGKTSGLRLLKEQGISPDDYAIIYDTNSNNIKGTTRRIDAIINSGRKPEMLYVYREPVEAFENGVIKRMQTQGRVVPVENHVSTHLGSQDVITQVAAKYGDNVAITAVDNSRGAGKAVEVPLEEIPTIGYNEATLRNALYDVLEKQFKAGNLNESQLKAFLEGAPEGAAEARFGQLIRGGLEQSGGAKRTVAAAAPVADEAIQPAAQTVGDVMQGGRIENINLDKIEDVKQIESVLQQASATYGEAMKAARGGTVSNKDTMDAARRLGLRGVRRLMKSDPEGWAAQVYATSDLVVAKAKRIKQLQTLAQDPAQATPIVKLQLQKEMAELGMVMSSAIKNRAAAGRALQIQKAMLKALQSPDVEAMYKVQKMAKQLGFDPDKIAKQISVLETPDEIYSFARNMYRPKIGDKARELFYNALLSAPSTHVVNIISNAGNLLLAPFEATLSGVVDTGLALGRFRKGFKRERYAREGLEAVIGMRSGVVDGFRKAFTIMRRGFSPDDVVKFELNHLPAIKTKYLGGFIRTPSKALVAADALFKNINYQAALRQGAYRMAKQSGKKGAAMKAVMAELLDNPTKELMDFAGDMAKYRLFQKDPDKITAAVMKLRGGIDIKGFRPIELVVPFVQTPVNVAKYGLERSPAGIVKVITQKGGNRADAIARTFIGGTAAAAIAFFFAEGKIVGAPPRQKAERDAFYRTGKVPYSVKIGDTWYSYQRLEPFNQIFGQIAMVQELIKEDPDADVGQMVAKVATGIGQNFVSQTYMQGISNLLDAIEDPERYSSNFMNNFGRMLVPSGVQQITRAMDPTIREVTNPAEAFMSGVPGASKFLAPKRDAFGQPIKRGGAIFAPETGNPLASFIPYKASKDAMNSFEQELSDLGDPIGYPSETARGFKWDEESYNQVLAISGPRIKKKVQDQMNKPGWDRKPETQKTKVIDKIISDERDDARDILLPVGLAHYYQIPVETTYNERGVLIVPGVNQKRLARAWDALKKKPSFKEADEIDQQQMIQQIFTRATTQIEQ